MGTFDEAQKKWVESFLGKTSRAAPSGSSLTGAANDVVPSGDGMGPPISGNADGGAAIPEIMKSQGVMMAGPTGGGVGGTTGGVTGGPSEKLEIWKVDPERLLKMNKLGTPVLQSVSSQAHADAWLSLHHQDPPVPIAFQVEKSIYVDMSRWPDNLAKPTITPHPPGGPKVRVPTGHKVPVAELPNDGTHSLGGTSPEPGGGAGKGPGGNVAVPDNEIMARHHQNPSKTTYTFSPSAHEDIWQHLGNKPPAPKAFIQDGHMRVDVERWALENGKWSNERLTQIGLKLKDSRLPTPPNQGGTPPSTGPKGEPTTPHTSPTATGGTTTISSKPPAGASSEKVTIPGADDFLHNAEELKKLSKDPKLDVEKVRKQNSSLLNEGEQVAKELRARPEFAGIEGKSAKEFFKGVRGKFGSVRMGASNLVMLAMDLANAYAIVEQARYLLDSKDIVEFEKRAFELGKSAVKERIKFGVLEFAFRSTPVAVGITVFLGDLDANGRKTASELFDEEIMNMVNNVRPGAVKSLGHMGTLSQFEDDDAKTLFYGARQQAKDTLKAHVAEEMTNIGSEDGLVGAAAKTKFEVSDSDEKILGIDEKWMEQPYKKGFDEGSRKRTAAVKRAHDTGYKTGIEGKPANVETLWNFPEIEAMRQRDFNREGRSDLNFTDVFNKYVSAYNDGYAEGAKKYGTRALESLAFYEGKSISGTQYISQRISAIAKFTAGPDVLVAKDGVWTASDPKTVNYEIAGQTVYASLKAVGSGTITVKYENGGITKEAHIEVKVAPPKVQIGPANQTYQVGDELPYTAKIETGPRSAPSSLPYDESIWTASPAGIVQISPVPSDMRMVADGNGVLVKMLKPGDVTITVVNKDKTIKATTSLKVKPASAGAR